MTRREILQLIGGLITAGPLTVAQAQAGTDKNLITQAPLPAPQRYDAVFLSLYTSPPIEVTTFESEYREYLMPQWAVRYVTAVIPATATGPDRWQRCELTVTSTERPQITAVLDCTITDIEPVAGPVRLLHGIVHGSRVGH